jgi:hypothetical protein
VRGIVALLWNPGPLVLELHRKSFPRNWMKALALAPRQSVHVQPGQGNGTTGASHLQGFELVEGLIEPSGEMSLVAGDFLQCLLIGKQVLPSHVPKIPLHLLRCLLLSGDALPGRVGGFPHSSLGSCVCNARKPARSLSNSPNPHPFLVSSRG